MQQKTSVPRIEDMGSTYQKLFKALPGESAPPYLCEQVLRRVSRERALHRRMRLAGASLSIVASAAGFLFAIPALISAAVESGFSSLAPLALTDSGVIAGHFSTFFVSLLETLPSVEILTVLFLTAVFLVAIRGLFSSFPLRTFRKEHILSH